MVFCNARSGIERSVGSVGDSYDNALAETINGLYKTDDKEPTDISASGDVTSQVSLWNAGTEVDQEPAVGDAAGLNQPAADYGAPDPDPTVREIPLVSALSDGSSFTRPAIDHMLLRGHAAPLVPILLILVGARVLFATAVGGRS